MSPAGSCGVGVSRFYERDNTAWSPHRHDVRSASGPVGVGCVAVGVSTLFHRTGWNRVLIRVASALLAPGKHTVTQALRVMGLAQELLFRRRHELLSGAHWDSKAVARWLLLDRPLPSGP